MANYDYCLVEGTYVVRRRDRGGAEYLTPQGAWRAYDDDWDVVMNGRPLENEAEALRTAEEIFARDPAWWAWQSETTAADDAYARGDWAEAERLWRAWLDFAPRDPRLLRSLDGMVRVYRAQGRLAEAAPLSARALTLEEDALGAEHPALAERLERHAALVGELGRPDEAAAVEARAESLRRRRRAPDRARRSICSRPWRRPMGRTR